MIAALLTRLEQFLFEPPDTIVGKPIGLLAATLRYPYALLRDIIRGDLTLRAMSLVYTTLLSIVPLIAVSFSVLKGLGYDEDLEPVLYAFLEPLGDKGVELANQIMGFVTNVRGDVLGSIGMVFLLYTVISMVQKVEESFNFIWRVEQPRSLGRRFSEYLSVMIVGPALIAAAFGLLAAFANMGIVQTVSRYEPFGWLLLAMGHLTPYLLIVGVFTFLYAFVPNTRVHVRAALIGGVVGGGLWATGGMVFTSFVAGSTNTMVIYAGFAIVIVALIWLHISWLILLIGAQLSFYVQHPQYLRPGRGEVILNSSMKERVALSIMYLVVSDYREGEHRWTTNSLAEHLGLPGAAVSPVVCALEKKKLLLLADDDTWAPGREPEAIMLNDVLEAVRHDVSGTRLGRIRDIAPAVEAGREAERAMRERLQGRTIKDLVRSHRPAEIAPATQESAAGHAQKRA